MTFGQFWSIVLKQWKLILICFLLVGLGTYIGSKLITPLYQSTALVQVAIRSGNNQADYNSLLASDQLVQTEASLAISDPVLREVASRYPGLTVQQLANAVTSTVKLNTQLFQIDVVNPSPAHAAALANDIAATLIRQQLQVVQQENTQSQQQVQQDLEGTRQNIDEFTIATARSLETLGGAKEGKAIIIDFPQAVSPYINSDAYTLFARDVERLCQYFTRYGIATDPPALAQDIWAKWIPG